MTFLSNFAQYSYQYTNYSSSTVDPAATAAIMAVTIAFFVIIGLVTYVLFAWFLSRIFKKAGVKPWIAWVPFYNSWKLLEIGGQQGFWAVLAILPIVNYVSAVFTYIAMYHVGKKLGKSGSFVLLAIFLPIVWMIWLAFDKSSWNDSASTARSLHVDKPSTDAQTPQAPTTPTPTV